MDTVTSDLPQFLTAEQVEALGFAKVQTLNNWRNQRKGPPFVRIGGKLIRYPRQKLMAWLEEHTVKTPTHTNTSQDNAATQA